MATYLERGFNTGIKKIMSQYEHYPNITFVERGSTDYLKWLAQS